ncbi:hypothetical protein QYF61_004056 [Mycteria americana]|uniref:Ig-like domain-containing protein n=1 Tax=Mycteria americana TaxID=33587 RepID=A0AAN7RMY0_MYCAM|nr:hypothetical protein QYF61_004056 [Mycteria americana]
MELLLRQGPLCQSSCSAQQGPTYGAGNRRGEAVQKARGAQLIFTGLQAQALDAEESRPEGSTLYIQCPYTAHSYHWQQKAWCLLRDGKCDPLVETTYQRQYPNTTRARKGRVSIEDDRTNRTVSITMTNLQAEDSGTYYCTYYDYRHGYLPLKKISLNVFKELHKSELDSLSVQCKYSAMAHSTDQKAWCRRQGQDECIFVVRNNYPSTRHNSRALEGRVSIQDDTQKRTVTITMKKLQAQDTGVYWCAFYSHLYFTRITEVKLSVSKSEYLPAAQCGCWQISAPPPLLVLPPVLHHTTEEASAAAAQLTPMSLCLPVSLADTLAAAPWACGAEAQAWPFTLCLLPAETQRSFPCAPTNGATLINCFPQGRSRGSRSSFPSSALGWPPLGAAGDLPAARHCPCSGPAAATPPWSLPPRPYGLSAWTQQYTAEESGNVSVQCRYSAPDYGAVSKAWCKEGASKECTVLVNTDLKPSGYLGTPQQGRVTIQDDTQQGTVTITMQQLQAQDSGVYWCALNERPRLLRMAEVTLSVSEVSAGTTLSGTGGTSQSTPSDNTPPPR